MTDIQKQLAEALDLANDLWSKGCTSERLVKACDLLRQQHRRIEALEVELIGLRNVHRQQEARGPLTDWVSTEDRMPDDGQEVLVCVNYNDGSGPYVMLDRWAMNREDPLGLGGPTIETGFTWDNNDHLDVTHWMPLPPAPDAAHGIKGE